MSEYVSRVKNNTLLDGFILRATSMWSTTIKRVFDIFAAALALLLLAPIFTFLAVLIQSDSPGPVFYRGPRVGRNGKIFHILKFRTMHENPASYAGPRVTAQDDPRVTKLGRWMRDTKLNELPQFWNVLIGEMSLVGPRPEDPEIAQDWPEDVRREILSVRPGITSPASVLYRDEESLLKAEQVMSTYLDSILPSKLRLDQLYVRHRSFWLDLDILFWTFLVLLPRLGDFSPPEENLFLGPVTRLIRRYVSWFTIDTIVTFIAIGFTGLFWRSYGPLDIGVPKAIAIGFGFAILFSVAGAIFGINRISWSNTGALDALDLLPSVGIAALIASLINWFWVPEPLLPPGMILMASGMAYVGFVIVRYRSRLIRGLVWRWLSIRGRAMEARERVLIIGGGEAGQFMAWLLHSGSGSEAFRAVGIIDDDLYKLGTRIQGLQVLGRRTDIPQLVNKYDIGIIVFAIHNIPLQERRQVLEICAATPARVVTMPDIIGTLKTVVSLTEGAPGTKPLMDPMEDISTGPYWQKGSTAQQFDQWLTDIDKLVQSGDIQLAREKIQSYREQIQAEIM